MNEKIKVLLVDDQQLVRDGISALLGLQENIEVLGSAADGVQATHADGSSLLFCRLVAEAHGGGMGIETVPGRQTAFWFQLPEGTGEQNSE